MWKTLFVFFFHFSFVLSQSPSNSYLFNTKYSFLLNQDDKNYNIGFFKNQILNPKYSLLAGFNFPIHSQPKFAQTVLLQKKWNFYFYNFGIYQNHFFTSIAYKNKKTYSFFFMETDKKLHSLGFHLSRGEKIQIGFSFVQSNWKEKNLLGIHLKIPLKKTLVSINHISRQKRTQLGLHIPYETQTPKTVLKKGKNLFLKRKRKSKEKRRKVFGYWSLKNFYNLVFQLKKH